MVQQTREGRGEGRPNSTLKPGTEKNKIYRREAPHFKLSCNHVKLFFFFFCLFSHTLLPKAFRVAACVCVCTDLSVLCDPSKLWGVKNRQHQTHCLSVAKGQRLRIYIVSGIYLNLQTCKQSGLIASTVFHSRRVQLCAPHPHNVCRFGCVGFGCLTVRPVRIIVAFRLQEGKEQ